MCLGSWHLWVIVILAQGEKNWNLTNFPLDKNGCHFMNDIFKCIFMNEKFCTLSNWTWFIGVQFTISQHWFRWWLGAKQAQAITWTKHWPSSWHICSSCGRWVKPGVGKFSAPVIYKRQWNFNRNKKAFYSRKCIWKYCLRKGGHFDLRVQDCDIWFLGESWQVHSTWKGVR